MADDRKKKIAVVSVCSLILVAMVVALAVGGQDKDAAEVKDVTASQKAITTICQSTDYQEVCIDSLKSSANDTTDPKQLIEIAFQAAIKYISEAAHNSTVVQAAEKDPKAKAAVDNCQELADRAVADLRRSYTKFNDFDVMNFNEMLEDMKIWLSGAITYQETCLEGFQGVEGDAGVKMQEALTKAMQLTSNGLAMVNEISTFLGSMGVQNFQARRLLQLPVLGHSEELPDWLDATGRKLLSHHHHHHHVDKEDKDDKDDKEKEKHKEEDKEKKEKEKMADLIVAKDGSGKYKTINEALKDVPEHKEKRFVLYIKEGIYEEQVKINSSMTHLMIIGDGPTKTKITGRLNFIDGVGTYQTATVAISADNFIAKDIGFENSAGAEKHQAVALRVSADKAIFYNCQMDGYQDTLYVHTYRQFYRNCVVSGTIDFIFGDSAAVFQNCTFVVRKPMANQVNIVTAQGRKDIRQPTGLVIQNCSIVADPEYYPFRFQLPSYLARPWKEYSRTIIMESFIDDLIHPEGYLPWDRDFALKTLFYTEFNNRGPASNKNLRVKWEGIKELPAKRVKRFTAGAFIEGNKWVKDSKVPYENGFIFPVPEEDPNVKYSPVVPEEVKDLGNRNKDKSVYVTKTPPAEAAPVSEIAAPPTDSFGPALAPALSPEIQPVTSTPAAAAEGNGEHFSIFKFFFRG